MDPVFKFGIVTDDDHAQERPYQYPNVFALQKTTGPERLVIAPAARQVAVLTDLLEAMQEPFWILYVLVVSRRTGKEGRFQTSELHSKDEVRLFLQMFEHFLENDGRHHLWIHSSSDPDMVVYDNHDLIYSYGDLRRFELIARQHKLQKIDAVEIPFPHTHKYNPLFDQDEEDVLQYWDWKHFPLKESDD